MPKVWIVMYLLMGISSWMVWTAGGYKAHKLPLIAYGIQLFLNFLWSPLFFGLHKIEAALADGILLWIAVCVTTYQFYLAVPNTIYLMAPYLIWTTFVTVLNFAHFLLNARVRVK